MNPTRPSPQHAQSGFTLLEIIVVLVLLGVAASIAGPSMQGVTSRARTRGALDQLTADIALARSYAVRDGRRTTLAILGVSRYALVRGTDDTLKTVDLSRDYHGVQLVPSTGQLTFDSRGLIVGAGSISEVKAMHSGSRDSLTISTVGRTYRDY